MTKEYPIVKALKQDKKHLLRFYKQQRYSARFIGFDHTYMVKNNHEIIAAVIVSALTEQSPQFFLHALVVAGSFKKQGIANLLLKHVQQHHNNIICFASPPLAPLYTGRNFTVINEEQLSYQLINRFQRYKNTKPCLAIFHYNVL
jgi:hypothetical protein